jgi:hypothetical protein
MASDSASTPATETSGRVSLSRVAIATVAALVVVVVANSIVFFLADAAGAFPSDVTMENWEGEEEAIGLGAVIFVSAITMIVAGVVLGVITLVSRRPQRVFSVIAAIVFLLTLYPPFTIPDAPGDMILALLFMHVIAAGVGTLILLRLATATR